MRPLRRVGLILLLLAIGAMLVPAARDAVPAALASSNEATAAGGETVFVYQRNKFFDPPVVAIHEGDTVVWVNDTRGGWHDVQSYEGLFGSPQMTYGHAFSRTFDESGTYGYFCTPHVIDGMQGVVVVLPKDAPLPDPLPLPAPSLTTAPGESVDPGSPDTITTVAGGGGSGGEALGASLYLPEGVAVDNAGRLFIADTENCQIRRVDLDRTIVSIVGHESCGYSMGGDADLGPWLHTNHPRAVGAGPDGAAYIADTINCRVRRVDDGGFVSTIAGTGSCRASGDGGPAAEAGLSPWGITWDGAGNLYVADMLNCRIRKVDGAGTITTVAGTGECGFSGDGGVATEAQLFFPRDVASSTDGTLYVADTENCRVRRVDATTNVIDNIAGTGACAYTGDGQATDAGLQPWGVAIDGGGDVLVADRANCRIRRFTPGGAIATIAGTGACGPSSDGGPATQAALHSPSDVATASDGSIYIADTGNCLVRRIDGTGVIGTVAGSGACRHGGDGGPAIGGGAWHPMGLAMAADGTWYFSELDTCLIRRIDTSGVVTAYAGTGICGFSGDGGPATEAQLSDLIGGMDLAADGTLYVAEGYNCRVRRIDPDGTIDTVAGTGICGFSGDGGPATEADLDFVADVALDGAGHLYIAGPFNCRVRRVDLSTGTIDTVVGDGSCFQQGEGIPATEAGVDPWGVAVGPDGDLYIGDSSNCRVRRVGADGLINTIAGGDECGDGGDGGPATEGQLMRPYDLVLDADGNVYFADLRTFKVRKIDGQGIITTVAGVGISRPVDIGGYDPTNGLLCSLHNLPVPAPSYMGDGGAATDAGLYFPYAIALGHDGHLYVADTFDHRVRRVSCGDGVPCVGPPERPGWANEAPGDGDAPDDAIELPSTGEPGGGNAPTFIAAAILAAGAAAMLAIAVRLLHGRLGRGRS